MRQKCLDLLKNKKLLRRYLPAIIAIILLISACLYTVCIKPSLGNDRYVYKEDTVKRGDLVLGIMESGSISMEESSLMYTVELQSEEDEDEDEDEEETIEYPKIETVYVVNGQRIKKGDPVFSLTQDSVEAVEKKLSALATETQIAYTQADAQYQVQLLSAKSTYDTSVLEAKRADSTYQAAGVRTRESTGILAAEIQVLEEEIASCTKQLEEEELWEGLEEAQTTFQSAENIYNETDVHNAAAYASNFSDYKSAKEQLESVQGSIDQLNETIEENQISISQKQRELEMAAASQETEGLVNESTYENTVLGGDLAQDIYDYTVSSLQETLDSAQNDLQEAEEELLLFTEFAGEEGIVYADADGLVTEVLYEEGDSIQTAGALISYVKENSYTVSIDVLEEDIPSISVGEEVAVVMAAYPEQSYSGTVLSITADTSSTDASTVSYPVIIRIEGDTSLLYGGMTAEVTFTSDSVQDVLYIPKKAVLETEGKYYVYTGSAANPEKKEVTTGFSDGTYVEIKSGLDEGDVIYIESKISGSEEELYQEEKTPLQEKDGIDPDNESPAGDNNEMRKFDASDPQSGQ